MSELDKLAAALAKAQGEIQPAPKDSDNPFFKSKYASLPAIREATREAFAKNGLSVVQMPGTEAGQLQLRTVLLHSSGQMLDCGVIGCDVDMSNPQKLGSAITYFRRYALAAISQTVADEDDDANEASKPSKRGKTRQREPLTGHQVVDLQKAINAADSTAALKFICKSSEYVQLRTDGPADVYKQTSELAKAKSELLKQDETSES